MAQIGTIKVQTQNSGIVSIPIFATGDSGSSVFEIIRTQTAGGTGFIPLTDPADATFPFLRVQTQNNGILAVHDAATVVTTVDSFEDGDLSEYGGELGAFSVSTNGAFDGTQFLRSSTSGDVISSTTGLSAYPSQGDTFSCRIKLSGINTSTRGAPLFATQGEDGFSNISGYGAIAGDNTLELIRLDTGTETVLDSDTTGNYTSGAWEEIEFTWDSNGNITATGPSLSVSAQDTTYTSGGIGFRAEVSGTGEIMDYDFYIIK